MYIGNEVHFRWLELIVKTVLVLNLFDAILTLIWVRSGRAKEANPLLDELVQGSPVIFVGIKLALVGLGSALLWRHRKRPLAVIGIFTGFMLYYVVLLYHLSALDVRLLSRMLG
jgi:hypothetical protein